MNNENVVNIAADKLARGELVALPTETVYGLAADASNPAAIKKIYNIKQRPHNHPLIVHISHINKITDWAIDIPDAAYKLANAFWPGPLTLVLKKAPQVNTTVTGGQDTIAIRIPNQKTTLEILEKFGGGIAAPSANQFSHVSPTSAQHVKDEFGEEVFIVDDGICHVGIESTIIDLTHGKPTLLRPGMITDEMVEDVIGQTLALANENSPRAPGKLEKHYAPKTKTYLLERDDIYQQLKNESKQVAVLALHEPKDNIHHAAWHVMPEDAAQYAHILYRRLRDIDSLDFEKIVIEDVPTNNNWAAIRDRLLKACA